GRHAAGLEFPAHEAIGGAMRRMVVRIGVLAAMAILSSCTGGQRAASTSPQPPPASRVASGPDVPGVYDPKTGSFFLGGTLPGQSIVASFGAPEMTPMAGDWDGDGVETVGVYDARHGVFFLKNSYEPGAADETFLFAWPNLVPLVGDWDGDGKDSVGV